MRFPNAEAVCTVKDPLDWNDEKRTLMIGACREMAVFHAAHSPEIAYLYKKRGFDPGSIESEEDLARVPWIGVQAMKYYLLTSLPHDAAVLKLTSSGTRGMKTQIWFDADSLRRVQSQLDGLWEQEGLTSKNPANYCELIYDPDEARDLGIAFSVKNEERFAPKKASWFAVKKNARGQWELKIRETIAKLREFEAEGIPVRFGGIPSFFFDLLMALEGERPFRFPDESMMMTGGGWKAAEDKSITREQFRALVVAKLGLREERVRDGYGMAEHSAPYMTCRNHRFHVPVYNRVYARDPVTLEILPPGRPGLLEFVTPFNAMMPTLAILSTDLGYLDPEPCPCGRNAPTFTLVGRGGLVKHKGCALTAGEIVKRD